jgi:hypothetical protein
LRGWFSHARDPVAVGKTPAQGPHGYQFVSVRAIPLAARLRHAGTTEVIGQMENMRRRSALAIAIIVGTLILSTAVPAQAAPRLRLYKGETSQGEGIKIKVAKNDVRRVVKEVDVSHVTLTCPDQTTLEFGFGFGFGGNSGVPITDRVFSFDDVFWDSAFHIAGELGPLRGQGTMSMAQAVITPDEQAAQLCTSGELTWEVEFVRTVSRATVDITAGFVVRAA